jgi:hypothetical protein
MTMRSCAATRSSPCREELMAWCEAHQVDYLFGLARNERLQAEIAAAMAEAKSEHQRTGQAARVYSEFPYQTRHSWSRPRRVVAKAEFPSGRRTGSTVP